MAGCEEQTVIGRFFYNIGNIDFDISVCFIKVDY